MLQLVLELFGAGPAGLNGGAAPELNRYSSAVAAAA